MDKRKRDGKLSAAQQYAIKYFVTIWTYLSALGDYRSKFALNWLWRNEEMLKVFVNRVMGMETTYRRGLLYNGYYICKARQHESFTMEEWTIIDNVFDNKLSMSQLPKNLHGMIDSVNGCTKHSIYQYLLKECERAERKLPLSKGNIYVGKRNVDDLQDGEWDPASGKWCLGDWEKEGMDEVDESEWYLCQSYPSDFVVVTKSHCITCIYDTNEMKPQMIAMVLEQNLLNPHHKAFIRQLMMDIFAGHNEIERDGCKALTGGMIGCGPRYDRFKKKGGKKVSFYTHIKEVQEMMKVANISSQFGALVDRYAHGALIDIIIGLFMLWCPNLLDSFFAYGIPHLHKSEYEPIGLERVLECKGPSAYQCFITKDYSCQVHVDADQSDFTLCYASHPDSIDSTPIDFTIPGYGLRLPINDGNLFAFRSDIAHATGFRRPSVNAVYVGGIVVNSSLSALMTRRNS